MASVKWEVSEWTPPDHPWDETRTVDIWCEICGQTQLMHDGNLDKAFDWLERLGRRADGGEG